VSVQIKTNGIPAFARMTGLLSCPNAFSSLPREAGVPFSFSHFVRGGTNPPPSLPRKGGGILPFLRQARFHFLISCGAEPTPHLTSMPFGIDPARGEEFCCSCAKPVFISCGAEPTPHLASPARGEEFCCSCGNLLAIPSFTSRHCHSVKRPERI